MAYNKKNFNIEIVETGDDGEGNFTMTLKASHKVWYMIFEAMSDKLMRFRQMRPILDTSETHYLFALEDIVEQLRGVIYD